MSECFWTVYSVWAIYLLNNTTQRPLCWHSTAGFNAWSFLAEPTRLICNCNCNCVYLHSTSTANTSEELSSSLYRTRLWSHRMVLNHLWNRGTESRPSTCCKLYGSKFQNEGWPWQSFHVADTSIVLYYLHHYYYYYYYVCISRVNYILTKHHTG